MSSNLIPKAATYLPVLDNLPNHPRFQELSGVEGENREENLKCQIAALNDYEAIQCWLAEFKETPTTYRCYQKEAERLLLWCIFVQKKALSSLTRDDLMEYQVFLADPQPQALWCGTKGAKRGTSAWKPFVGPLSPKSQDIALSVIYSLMSFLYTAHYLSFNPLVLMRQRRRMKQSQQAQALEVQARILEDDEWQAILEALIALPEKELEEKFYKYRLKLIVYLLYFLGLRIDELVTHNWSAFRKQQGAWWFYVVGKGKKPGKIPVNPNLLLAIAEYRRFCEKSVFPEPEEHTSIIVRSKGQKALGARRINGMLKGLALEAAKQFVDKPAKVAKLKRFSAHWLRHLSATMQDRAGVKAKYIQANHRHEKLETTSQYIHALDKDRHEAMKQLTLTPQAEVK